jgi:hypothetical protein
MELPPISPEQANVLHQLTLNKNVIVDSVAGSGKTTCNLHIAKHFDTLKILLLTYNSKLKMETRIKAALLGLTNIEVHTYHSFCLKYYDSSCHTDTTIYKILKNRAKPVKPYSFDFLIPDEAQDISGLYFELICKIAKDNIAGVDAGLCIFGDKNQSIFQFNNADQRFIENADALFRFNTREWTTCNLPTSFRLTPEMAHFVNRCMLGEERILALDKKERHGEQGKKEKPRYIICNCFDVQQTFNEVRYYLDECGYAPEDIFILAPSVVQKGLMISPVVRLENEIKRQMPHVLVYVPLNDNEKMDEDVLNGKLIISTFHQTKGLERKVVIVFNFDASYYEYYNKNASITRCPNELYVATTRAIERLSLFHHESNAYLPFLNVSQLETYCHVEGQIKEKKGKGKKEKKEAKKETKAGGSKRKRKKEEVEEKEEFAEQKKEIKYISMGVTDMFKFLPQKDIDDCFEQLHIEQDMNFVVEKIHIPLKIQIGNTAEGVGEITGIAIPSMLEYRLKKKIQIYEELLTVNFEAIFKHVVKPMNLNRINLETITPGELLYLSNCWHAHKNKYVFKMYQITAYDWLTEEHLELCMQRCARLGISEKAHFELGMIHAIQSHGKSLHAYVDCVDDVNKVVYEFKCVQKLQKEHYLQLAMYMYMHMKEKEEEYKYVLFNLITNEYMVVRCTLAGLQNIVEHILHAKTRQDEQIAISAFLDTHQQVLKKYFAFSFGST